MSRKKKSRAKVETGLLDTNHAPTEVVASDQPEAQIKPMVGSEQSPGQYQPDPGEPPPERTHTRRGLGLYAFQQHGGSKRACKNFDTRAASTKTEFRRDNKLKIITRYRICNICQTRYRHVTILSMGMDGMWSETSSGFASA